MTSFINALPGALSQGLIWGIMAIGLYITYRLMDIADLTVDGSFCTGGAVCVMLILGGCNVWVAIVVALLAGMIAGLVTGVLHTTCGIPAILAGILTQLALWSGNLAIMGMRANQTLNVNKYQVLVSMRYLSDVAKGKQPFYMYPIFTVAIGTVVIIAILYWFFGTELGCSLRATGANPNMARARGINITKLPEHLRAQYIGRVFQDPMMGTAATMQIGENLALAKRRGRKRTLKVGITPAEREEYKKVLKTLDLGLEDRLTAKVGLLSGGQRQALTLLMAALQKPKLLLLDEHTAALDPKTAAKVLATTEKIVTRDRLTTVMITHNMKDAIAHGNRLIMMYEGRIVVDISGEEKKNLTVEYLLQLFEKASGQALASDRMLLS